MKHKENCQCARCATGMSHSEFLDGIADNIEKHGRHLLGVFDSEPPFVYTIGNTEQTLPELICVGTTELGGVLNRLSDMMIERKRAFDDGELVDLGGQLPVKIISATDNRVKTDFTVQVGEYYGSQDYAVMQVLVPDREGRYPDNPKCAKPYKVTLFGGDQVH